MQCSRCGGVYSNVSLFHLLNMLLQMRQIKVLLEEEFKPGFPKLRKAGKEENPQENSLLFPHAAFQST